MNAFEVLEDAGERAARVVQDTASPPNNSPAKPLFYSCSSSGWLPLDISKFYKLKIKELLDGPYRLVIKGREYAGNEFVFDKIKDPNKKFFHDYFNDYIKRCVTNGVPASRVLEFTPGYLYSIFQAQKILGGKFIKGEDPWPLSPTQISTPLFSTNSLSQTETEKNSKPSVVLQTKPSLSWGSRPPVVKTKKSYKNLKKNS